MLDFFFRINSMVHVFKTRRLNFCCMDRLTIDSAMMPFDSSFNKSINDVNSITLVTGLIMYLMADSPQCPPKTTYFQ